MHDYLAKSFRIIWRSAFCLKLFHPNSGFINFLQPIYTDAAVFSLASSRSKFLALRKSTCNTGCLHEANRIDTAAHVTWQVCDAGCQKRSSTRAYSQTHGASCTTSSGLRMKSPQSCQWDCSDVRACPPQSRSLLCSLQRRGSPHVHLMFRPQNPSL